MRNKERKKENQLTTQNDPPSDVLLRSLLYLFPATEIRYLNRRRVVTKSADTKSRSREMEKSVVDERTRGMSDNMLFIRKKAHRSHGGEQGMRIENITQELIAMGKNALLCQE